MNNRYIVRPLEQILRQNLLLDTTEKGEERFDYFTFDREIPLQFIERWEIFGINEQASPKRINLRIFHVDDDMFGDRKRIPALTEARNYLSLIPEEYRALIEYLYAWYPEIKREGGTQSHFHLLQPSELIAMNISKELLWLYDDSVYRYIPSGELTGVGFLPVQVIFIEVNTL